MATQAAVLPATQADVRSILRSQQFTREWCAKLFERSDQLRPWMNRSNIRPCREFLELREFFRNRIVVDVFEGESTRTRTSFEIAAKRLGCQTVISLKPRLFSSMAKDESFVHTMKVWGCYHPDCIVIRWDTADVVEQAAKIFGDVPTINAGSGAGQHPTQSLLDLHTILLKLGRLNDLTIVIGGDLKYGRTVKSLAYLLSNYSDIHLIFVAPEELRITDNIKEHLSQDHIRARGVTFEETTELRDALPRADGIYWTRIQKNLFPKGSDGKLTSEAAEMFSRLADLYSIGEKELALTQDHTILMHPMPINDEHPEISRDVSDPLALHPKCVIFDQLETGLYDRAAMLEWCMEGVWWDYDALRRYAESHK